MQLEGKYYKGPRDLQTTYKSPVDMQIQLIRAEAHHILSLAIV